MPLSLSIWRFPLHLFCVGDMFCRYMRVTSFIVQKSTVPSSLESTWWNKLAIQPHTQPFLACSSKSQSLMWKATSIKINQSKRPEHPFIDSSYSRLLTFSLNAPVFSVCTLTCSPPCWGKSRQDPQFLHTGPLSSIIFRVLVTDCKRRCKKMRLCSSSGFGPNSRDPLPWSPTHTNASYYSMSFVNSCSMVHL